MAVCPKWTIFALVMKTRQELTEILDFIAEYATYLLGSGVHTSRVLRNSQRIGASQGVDLQLSSFQKSTIITAHDEESGEAITRVVKIPALPISFERNSDLSALSWDALDERLPLSEIRRRYDELTAKPRIDPIFVLQNRRACPMAASRAIRGKARIGGSETAPKPMAAMAAKSPSRRMSAAIIVIRL